MTTPRPARTRHARSWCLVAAVAALVVVTGCSGSSGDTADQPTTSFEYLVDPLEPGHGFIQLGQNRYPFEGVICASGAVKSDPEGSTRIFGVYANFEIDGKLAAVALTRYHNEVHGKTNSIPTLTETALIQMQGDHEIRGLSAKRFQVVGARKWQDPADPSATSALITHKGDRYEAKGTFAPVNADVATASTTSSGGTGTGAAATSDAIVGEVAARCPGKSAKTTTTATTTTGASTTAGDATDTTAAATTTGGTATTIAPTTTAPPPTSTESGR